MPQVLFYGLGAIATGLLNAHRRFAVPMFAPIVNNLIVIATFLTFAAMAGPAAGSGQVATDAQRLVLAIGTTLGVAGDDPRPVAFGPRDGLPLPVDRRLPPRGGPDDRRGSRRGWSSTSSRTSSCTS